MCDLDKSGQSIGRRYARADEIGTPFAVTVDHESLEDGTVTIRERNSMEQVRVNVRFRGWQARAWSVFGMSCWWVLS